MKAPILTAWAAILLLSWPASLPAQGRGALIEENYLTKNNADLIARAQALKKDGRLVLDEKRAAKALAKPVPMALTLPPVSRRRLEPEVIAAKARKALIRVGWLCLCSHCDRWHANLSGGYAITTDGIVVTCYHVVSPKEQSMREGYLVAVDTDGHVFPVTGILAADKELDTAIIRVDAPRLTALPVNDESLPGAAAFVFSDPLGVAGYFSAGLVNRYYWEEGDDRPEATTLEAVRSLRMNVSTDWGPGSSGAAVLDACGNAIGHVSVINPMGFDDDGGKTPKTTKASPSDSKNAPATAEPEPDQGTILVLHEAIPARGVKLLIEAMQRH